MKSKTFLRWSLTFPYLFWVISAPMAFIPYTATQNIPLLDPIRVVLTVIGLLYGIGIIFWGIPYTILVIGLLIWSRNKSSNRIYKALFYSPFLLSALTVIGALASDLLFSAITPTRLPLHENLMNLIWFSFLGTILNLIFGYFFVGVFIGSYKIFERLKLIQNEVEITEDVLLTPTKIPDEGFGDSIDK